MPELPDIEAYVAALRPRVQGETLRRARVSSPFLVRTADPPLSAAEGLRVEAVRRAGKRVVLGLEQDLFLALHLMIAGRLHWREPGKKLGRAGKPLAELEFEGGALVLTEAGSRRRAALHLVRGREALVALDRGGVEPLEVDRAGFGEALSRESHTLKRALTDPRLFSGIGNAYSDEILHRARLSPVELGRLFDATRAVLSGWRDRLVAEAQASRTGFPEKVTAFRDGFAVHGRHRLPCPDCGAPVQRIVRGEHETNYCPRCQTGGKILSDRSLSRLLREDWPRTLEELEQNPALGLREPGQGKAAAKARSRSGGSASAATQGSRPRATERPARP